MREQNAIYMTHVLPIYRLQHIEYVYSKAVMTAPDYVKTAYSDVRIFM